MKCFTKREYVERLSDLIPECHKFNKLVITADTVKTATTLIEDIAGAMHETFEELPETDLVVEVKNATRDLFVLGRFLDISFETILTDGM